jgi:S1-C subfamily serine protease
MSTPESDEEAGRTPAGAPLPKSDAALLERAERLFAGGSVSDRVGRRVRAIIATQFPESERDANLALQKMRQGEVPSPAERAALVRMVKIMRPSILSTGGRLEDLPQYFKYPAGTLERWNRFRNSVAPFLFSIGRIDAPQDATVGTGFLVAPDLVATNRHVLNALTAGTEALGEGMATIRFGAEFKTTGDLPAVPLVETVGIHPGSDLALLRLGGTQNDRPALELAADPMPVGHPVAVIGYPCEDARNPVFVDALFEKHYGVKRAAPGEVVGRSLQLLHHDCSTLGGNSGSPVLSMESGAVVGVHAEGPLFLYRNEAVEGAVLVDFVHSHRHKRVWPIAR